MMHSSTKQIFHPRSGKLALLCSIALAAMISGPVRASTIWVNWSDFTAGTTNQNQFGTNDQQCINTIKGSGDATYAGDLNAIGTKFLRIHDSSITQGGWTTGTAWNQTKIAAEYNSLYVQAVGGSHIIQTIPSVPSWLINPDGSVNTTGYANFCAQLVQIINVNLGEHVQYWEPMNEFDNNIYKNNIAGECALYNQCADAMKAVDSSIKIGGPVSSWMYSSLINQFLDTCWTRTDFISWHHYFCYSSNPGTDTPTKNAAIYSSVMQKIVNLDTDVSSIKNLIATQRTNGHTGHNDGRTILLALDELNIPVSSSYTGWGQDGYVGATFFASALKHLTADKIDILTNWSAKDGVYGMIDMSDNMRPAATVYSWANNNLVGSIAANGSDNADCECLPIYRGATATGDKHSFLLINKSVSSNTIFLQHGLPINQTAHLTLIDSAGVHTTTTQNITTTNPAFSLGGFACELITLP